MKGLAPTPVDPHDKHFRHDVLFGAATSFPDEFLVDNDLFPDQNADGRPTVCTGYTVANVGGVEDSTLYSPEYNYMKTLEVQGLPPETQGADARTAFKIPVAFGLLPQTLVPPDVSRGTQAWAANQTNWPLSLDTQAVKKPAYTPIGKVGDYFDGIRSAISQRKTVGMATQWSPSFETVSTNGILPDNPVGLYWGHMYQVCGWKTFYGVPYLVLKTWQGKGYGDRGWCYMSRSLCNKLMGTLGAYAATLEYLPQDTVDELKGRELTLLEVVLGLLQNLYLKVRYGIY